MTRRSARRGRANRLARLLAASAVAASAATALVAAPAGAAPGDGAWSRTIQPSLSRADLGLPKGASNAKLAARAIERSERKLVRNAELGDLRFVGEPLAARAGLHALRFTQRLGGLRVLWSELDVAIARGEVRAINASVLPLRSTRLTGKVKISAAKANAVARKLVAGEEKVNRTELVAYAGAPDRPRPARRAFVVDVTPASANEEIPLDLCVVVDAQTGKVITTWRGYAAPKPQRTSKSASSAGATAHAAATTTLVQADDAQGQNKSISNSRKEAVTFGNPYNFSNDGTNVFGGGFTSAFDRAFGWSNDVSRFFCKVRGFCGRDSGLPGPVGGGSFNRNFFTLNWVAPSNRPAEFRVSEERMMIGTVASDSPNIIAHEFGHQIDFRFRNDYFGSIESMEVDEALGDMFTLDYEQGFVRNNVTHPTTTEFIDRVEDFLNPITGGDYPGTYSAYQCNNRGDIHLNGTILARAYRRLVSFIGADKAGAILQSVPWALPAARTFSSVRVAFKTVAGWYHGVNSFEARRVGTAFAVFGVSEGFSSRAQKCPGQAG
jgi:Zn-dependent metalloprotease